MNLLLSDAIKIAEMPDYFTVQGKYLAPEVFFSSALTEGPAMWLAQSLSKRLFDSNVLNLSLVCATNLVSGVKVENLSTSDAISVEPSHNMASALLLTTEAAALIAEPAITSPGVDYANFILRFRESIKQNFKNGDIIHPDHALVGKVVEDNLNFIRKVSGTQPQPQKPGR